MSEEEKHAQSSLDELMYEPLKLPFKERRFVEILLFEILSRLPVKELLGCMCVCKFWFAFISRSSLFFPNYSSSFVPYHRLLLIKRLPSFKPPPWSGLPHITPQMIGYPALKTKHLLPILVDQVDLDEFPFDLDHDTTTVGSLGGVTCLFADSRASIVLMKPHNITASDISDKSAITAGAQVSKLRIPAHEGRRRGFYPCYYGMCYVSTIEGYKIVLGNQSLVHVYSVGSERWSVINGPFCGLILQKGFPMLGKGCYVMGALHWLLPPLDDDDDDDDDDDGGGGGSGDGDSGSDLVAGRTKSLIVAFNLEREEFMTLKIIDHPDASGVGIGNFGNYSLFYYICNETRKDDSDPIAIGDFIIELWVLEEYRLDTWVKIGEIHPEDLPGRLTWFKPIFIAPNGEIVLRSRGCTVFYSLMEKKIISRIDGVEDAAMVLRSREGPEAMWRV